VDKLWQVCLQLKHSSQKVTADLLESVKTGKKKRNIFKEAAQTVIDR